MENQPKWHGHLSHLSLSFLLSLWCTCDCCHGNGNLLTRGVSGDGVKIICTCSWGAVCQVNTCHQALDGLRPHQTSTEISLKLLRIFWAFFFCFRLEWCLGDLPWLQTSTAFEECASCYDIKHLWKKSEMQGAKKKKWWYWSHSWTAEEIIDSWKRHIQRGS